MLMRGTGWVQDYRKSDVLAARRVPPLAHGVHFPLACRPLRTSNDTCDMRLHPGRVRICAEMLTRGQPQEGPVVRVV